jgi:hypothetical protein
MKLHFSIYFAFISIALHRILHRIIVTAYVIISQQVVLGIPYFLFLMFVRLKGTTSIVKRGEVVLFQYAK